MIHKRQRLHACDLRIEQLEKRLFLSSVPPTVSGLNISGSHWDQGFINHLESSGLGSDGYSIPVGSSAQSDSLPWIDIDQIKITFSEDVNVDSNDLSISGVTNSTYEVGHFIYDPATRVATWTLTTPLAAGEKVHLDLDGDGVDPVIDLDGNILDGDWVDEVSTFESGNSSAGGDFQFSFNVLEGDAYTSNLVDYLDYVYTYFLNGLSTQDAQYDPLYDINGSGTIDSTDWQEVVNHLWGTLPTGTTPGSINDAPTTTGFNLLGITDRTNDTTLTLFDFFEDNEDSDSSLAYSIVSQSNSNLLDTLSINSTTGELTINAAATGSGRNVVMISATDTGGLSVVAPLTLDIGNYTNSAPIISDFLGVALGGNVWEVTGTVTDSDDEVEGMIVVLEGAFEARVVVRADGTFLYQTIVHPDDWDWEYATTWDAHGTQSNSPTVFIGLS